MNRKENAFSLVEAVTALVILAIVCSGVVVVISRCIASAADSQIRMQAFEVARENMEKLLASNLVKETTDFGNSDKYPEIKWQTVVETFYDPITARMWVRGVCSAEYTDTEGQTQMVELTHWLTDVTKEQLLQILANKEKEKQQEQELLAAQLIGTIEEAAKYAGVDVPTVQKWVESGMVTVEDGSFVKKNLDIFKESNGNPPPEVKSQQTKSVQDLTEPTAKQPEPSEPPGKQEPPEGEQTEPKTTEPKTTEPKTTETEPSIPEEKHIYTAEELRQMGFPEELIPMCLQLLNSD
jgi:type II secretory pathway pseudopilin PulG